MPESEIESAHYEACPAHDHPGGRCRCESITEQIDSYDRPDPYEVRTWPEG